MDVQYEKTSIALYREPEKKTEYSTDIRCPQIELAGQDGLANPSKQLTVRSQQWKY